MRSREDKEDNYHTLTPLRLLKKRPRCHPLELDEFRSTKFPPLDTTTLMKLTKYSFFKRKALCINANVPKPASELQQVLREAKKLVESNRRRGHRSASISPGGEFSSPVKTANYALKTGKKCCVAKILKNFDTTALRPRKDQGMLKKHCQIISKQLYNNNREMEKSRIRFFRNIGEREIQLERPADKQWGCCHNAMPARSRSVFGRTIKRSHLPSEPPKYTRDSLERLVLSDLRRYDENEEQFINNYAVSMVSALLLQTDKGSKFRKPISFLDDRQGLDDYS